MRARIGALYAPQALEIESQGFLDEDGYFGTSDTTRISLLGLRYMAYGQYRVTQLREAYAESAGVEYDYVVMLRPDILLYVALDFRCFEKEFDYYPRSSVHLCLKTSMQRLEDRFLGLPRQADCFFFASAEVMSEIGRLYLEFEYFFRRINETLPEGVGVPEVAFLEYLYQRNILPRLYRFYYAIKRTDPINDLGVLPPNPTSPQAREDAAFALSVQQAEDAQRHAGIKHLLKLIVQHGPRPAVRLLRSGVSAIRQVGDFLDRLPEDGAGR